MNWFTAQSLSGPFIQQTSQRPVLSGSLNSETFAMPRNNVWRGVDRFELRTPLLGEVDDRIFARLSRPRSLRPGLAPRLQSRQPDPTPGQTVSHTITVNDVAREYNVYVPSTLDPNQPAPVVIALHGGQSSNIALQQRSGFDEIAEKEGFIVVYPNALQKNWNDGRPEGFNPATEVDDVAFISNMITQLGEDYFIDPNQVFAMGISNGGGMAHRLGMELSDQVAAIAPVAISIPKALAEQKLDPEKPVSVLMINGTKDPAVPYNGNEDGYVFLGKEAAATMSAQQNLQLWTAFNDGAVNRSRFVMPNTAQDKTITYGTNITANNGANVTLMTVVGGGHYLPGTAPYLPERLVGVAAQDFNGAQVIWDFFEANGRSE